MLAYSTFPKELIKLRGTECIVKLYIFIKI